MFEKKCFDPPPPPGRHKSHPWGMTKVTEWKSCLICFVSFICITHTKFGLTIFWNWHVNQNLMIFDLLISLQGHQFDPRLKIYLHSVLLVIPVNLICHMTMFEIFFWPPRHPQLPKVRPLWHDPGKRIKVPSDMFCIFHLWEQTQSLVFPCIYKNLWNWLCNWNEMIFDLLTPPQGPRGAGPKKLPLHAPFMWVTHTPNLVEFRPTV